MYKVEYDKYKIICFTENGRELAKKLAILLITNGKAKWMIIQVSISPLSLWMSL